MTQSRRKRQKSGSPEAAPQTRSRVDGYFKAVKNGHRLINEKEAREVRRIFEMRALGLSALTIARRLNDVKVPSSDATWNRKEIGKTTSGIWRTSVIAGDPNKEHGILNYRLYIGEVVLGSR